MIRMVVVQNTSDAEIVLRERFSLSLPSGCHGYEIRLPPRGRCDIPATRFYNRNLYSGRPAIIVPYVNEEESSTRLMAHDFLRYVKLSLYLDHNGGLTVKGVEPKLTDFGRFWGLGYLMGREYKGRPEEVIR